MSLPIRRNPCRAGFTPVLTGLLLALLLSACGFRLAGTRPLPPSLSQVFVVVQQPYRVAEPPLYAELKARLEQQGATVLAKSDATQPRLRLWDLTERRETLSVGTDGKALEYRLSISVRYALEQGETVLVAADQVTVARDFGFKIDQILAKEAEEVQLREFIHKEIAELLLLKLQARLAATPN